MTRSLLMTMGLALGASLFLAGGCAPPGKNLSAAGAVSVERQSAGAVKISRIDVYQDGEMLVVDGSLRRSSGHTQRTMGHIDIAVVDPAGRIMAQKSFRDAWLGCRGGTFFTTMMPLMPPKGSTVCVVFHNARNVHESGHTDQEWETMRKNAPKT